jgi:alkaline phosphatase
MASGTKTTNLFVGVDPDGNPLTSILEKAERAGMSTGIVVTREVTDATPAAFSSHVRDRYDDEMEIAIQQINSGVDLLVGGGLEMFTTTADGGKREDGRNLVAEAEAMGYTVATSRAAWDANNSLPVIGLLAQDKLAYEIDRRSSDAPSLAELTERAIQLLDDSASGFFLLVEGSRIDLAGHDNDAVAHLHDLIEFDESVKAALDFARQDGNTLVVSVSDHETGGLTVGRSYKWFPELLADFTASHDTVVTRLQNGMEPREALRQYYAINDVTDEEEALLKSLDRRNDYDRALGQIVGDRLLIDWASLGHTAVDVNLYAFGPGSENFRGHFDNTWLGIKLPELLGLE